MKHVNPVRKLIILRIWLPFPDGAMQKFRQPDSNACPVHWESLYPSCPVPCVFTGVIFIDAGGAMLQGLMYDRGPPTIPCWPLAFHMTAAVGPGSGRCPGEQEQVLLSEVAVLNLWRPVLAKHLPVIVER